MRGSVESYPRAAVERAMKVQEVILRAMAKKITVVAGSGDHRDQRPIDAPLAARLKPCPFTKHRAFV